MFRRMFVPRGVPRLVAGLFIAVGVLVLVLTLGGLRGRDSITPVAEAVGAADMSLESSAVNIPVGGEFTVTVNVNSLAGLTDVDMDGKAGYAGYQARISWTSGLNLISAANVWPDCYFLGGPVPAPPITGAGDTAIACAIGIGAEESTYTGAVATFGLTCGSSPSIETITMLVGGSPLDTLLADESYPPQEVQPKPDSITVHCTESAPTATPTPTPTPTGLVPTMSLDIKHPACPEPKEDKCNIPQGELFTLSVSVNDLGGLPDKDGDTEGGYVGVQARVNHPPGLNFRDVDFTPWPDCEFAAGPNVEAGTVLVGCLVGDPLANNSTYLGDVFDLTFDCDTVGSHQLDLVVGAPLDTLLLGENYPPQEVQPTEDSVTVNCEGSVPTATPTPTPEGPALTMSLDIKHPACPNPKEDKCDIPQGDLFTLSVSVNGLGGLPDTDGDTKAGYLGVQARVNHPPELGFKDVDFTPWPDCEFAAGPAVDSGSVSMGCIIGIGADESTHVGDIFDLTFNCDVLGSHKLDLVMGIPKDTYLVNENLEGVLPESGGSLTVNCTESTPGLLESVSTTIGPGGGLLSTGTEDSVEAFLSVPNGALSEDTTITIDVFNVSGVPLPPGGGDFLQRAFVFGPGGTTFNIPATVTFIYADSAVTGLDESHLGVWLFNSLTSEWELAEIIFRSTATNSLIAVLPHFSATTLGDLSSSDFDGDGCSDAHELGEDETRGGLRDLSNFWDFFDVDFSGAVGTSDVVAVVSRFGSFGDPTGDPLSEPPPPPAYHPRFDRTLVGPDPWDLGMGSGGIAISDIVAAVSQFGHSCVAPP